MRRCNQRSTSGVVRTRSSMAVMRPTAIPAPTAAGLGALRAAAGRVAASVMPWLPSPSRSPLGVRPPSVAALPRTIVRSDHAGQPFSQPSSSGRAMCPGLRACRMFRVQTPEGWLHQTTPRPGRTPDMTKALIALQQRLRREEGATAVEYGLMVALIAIVIIAAVALIGNRLDLTFDEVAASLA